jgi:transitional endoplasmic reticulum ATPase
MSAALDGLLAALKASGDARLIVPALDLAGDDVGLIIRVLDALDAQNPGLVSDDERTAIAAAAVKAQRWDDALGWASGQDSALASEVRARIGAGDLAGAESRYRAAIAANPALEDPALLEEIGVAKVANPAASDTNILAFNRVDGRGPEGPVTDQDIAGARLAFAETAGISFADVGGHEDVKKQISRRIIAPFLKPTLFARFRRKAGGGVLLYGPPGCGKTLLARATAGECKARFINVPVTDVLDKYIGEPERKLAAIFEDARRDTPTVLFFDEIEALAGKRANDTGQHHIGIISTFLSELDGFAQNNEGVLILAATNMPWAVDAAFRRSGRFDRMLFVPPPDKGARAEILRLQLDGRPLAADLSIERVVAATGGFSGADLQNLVDTAADFAIEDSVERGSEQPINAAHLDGALGEVKATTIEWLTTARNFTKYGNSGGQYDEVADFLKRFGK